MFTCLIWSERTLFKEKKHTLSICLFCSAGAGRTGTFIALSNILERVKAEGLLDVFQTVKSLRMQRPHMVQTVVSMRQKADLTQRDRSVSVTSRTGLCLSVC